MTQQPRAQGSALAGLRADPSWASVQALKVAASTNDTVADRAQALGDLGQAWLAAAADQQTAGRGRGGHTWFSSKGGSLLLSLAAQLQLPPQLWPRASLVVGGAVAEVLQQLVATRVWLKWPNDLLVVHEGAWRKVGGVLCERRDRPRHPAIWVAGIGINVDIEPAEFPAALRPHVASLRWLGADVARDQLAEHVAQATRRATNRWVADAGRLDLASLQARLAFIGAQVSCDFGAANEPLTGALVGLAADGGLRIRTHDGTEQACQPLQLLSAESEPPWTIPPDVPN